MKVFVIVRGGLVQSIHADTEDLIAEVIDLDDLDDEPNPEKDAALAQAKILPAIY